MPGVNKAQLIEGIVHMPSPVRISSHSHPHARIVTLLGLYESFVPGVEAGDNGSLRLDLDNMPQPDAYLRRIESAGGQSKLSADDYLEGAPELVFEIAGTSASVDLNAKLRAYRRNGVKEYAVWLTDDNAIQYHILIDGDYQILAADDSGIIKSIEFPGLWFDIPALLSRNSAKQVATLQAGIGRKS